MRDDEYLDLVAGALGAVREQTEAAKARGLDLAQTRKAVDVAELGRRSRRLTNAVRSAIPEPTTAWRP